jgi:hypothetical protein
MHRSSLSPNLVLLPPATNESTAPTAPFDRRKLGQRHRELTANCDVEAGMPFWWRHATDQRRNQRRCCSMHRSGSLPSRRAPGQRSRCWWISPSVHHYINDAASKTKDVIANLTTRREIIREIQENTITP